MYYCIFVSIQDKELKNIGQMYKKYFKQLTFGVIFCCIFIEYIFNILIINNIKNYCLV